MNISNFSKYSVVSIASSVAILVTLSIDYFLTKSFSIESGFLVLVTILLVTDIVRHSNFRVWRRSGLGIAVNVMKIACSFYGYFILLMTLFGYGFSGTQLEPIWLILAFVNTAALILTIVDFISHLSNR